MSISRNHQRLKAWLWASRLLVAPGIAICIALSLFFIVVSVVDLIGVVSAVGAYSSQALTGHAAAPVRMLIVSHAIEALDGVLLAATVLVFGWGLYSVFIGPLEQASQGTAEHRALLVGSLQELKHRLVQLVLVVALVRVLEVSLGPLANGGAEIVFIAAAFLLLALALHVGNLGANRRHTQSPHDAQSVAE
jgi:uncharacterized membrane protein YqhA